MANSELTIQLKAVLDDYSAEVKALVEKELKSIVKETAQKLKSTSPRKTGEYASGWTFRRDGDGYIVYNGKSPGLTHLLENGHVIKNRKGTYGRTRPIKHIQPVEQWANEEVVQRIERGIK